MKVREFYKPYIDAVDSYFSKLLPLFTDLQVLKILLPMLIIFLKLLLKSNTLSAGGVFLTYVNRVPGVGE